MIFVPGIVPTFVTIKTRFHLFIWPDLTPKFLNIVYAVFTQTICALLHRIICFPEKYLKRSSCVLFSKFLRFFNEIKYFQLFKQCRFSYLLNLNYPVVLIPHALAAYIERFSKYDSFTNPRWRFPS